jgi:FdhD protein
MRRGSLELDPVERNLLLESSLIISLNWVQEFSIMRTPGQDEELTVGFLFTEGVIQAFDEIVLMRKCAGEKGGMDVRTVETGRPRVKRATAVSSSCGLCGRVDLDGLLQGIPLVPDGFAIPALCIHDLPGRVRGHQDLFEATGASHAVALFDSTGAVLAIREDVGRHNALDKIIGSRILNGETLSDCGIFLSGRASLEMIIKAARAKVPLVAAVSAPTDLAVKVSERLNITLCGFVRGQEFTVYTHPERILAK